MPLVADVTGLLSNRQRLHRKLWLFFALAFIGIKNLQSGDGPFSGSDGPFSGSDESQVRLRRTWNIRGISLASARYTSVWVTGLTWKSLLGEGNTSINCKHNGPKYLRLQVFLEAWTRLSLFILTLYRAPCKEWTALCLARCCRRESSCCLRRHTRYR